MNPVVQHELAKIEKSYQEAYDRLSGLIRRNGPETQALIVRLLTSQVLVEAMGSFDPRGIGNGYNLREPLDRMHFVAWFVGHEILDDGMPVMAWHKFDIRSMSYIACDKHDPRAVIYVHHTVDEVPEDSDVVDYAETNAILDAHEELAKARDANRARLNLIRGREVESAEDPRIILLLGVAVTLVHSAG